MNYHKQNKTIHPMRSTVTSRGQTVVPTPIRERFGIGPSTRLEWIVDSDGSIRVVPVDLDPIRAFRGSGAAAQQEGAVLVHKDPVFKPLAQLPQEWLG